MESSWKDQEVNTALADAHVKISVNSNDKAIPTPSSTNESNSEMITTPPASEKGLPFPYDNSQKLFRVEVPADVAADWQSKCLGIPADAVSKTVLSEYDRSKDGAAPIVTMMITPDSMAELIVANLAVLTDDGMEACRDYPDMNTSAYEEYRQRNALPKVVKQDATELLDKGTQSGAKMAHSINEGVETPKSGVESSKPRTSSTSAHISNSKTRYVIGFWEGPGGKKVADVRDLSESEIDSLRKVKEDSSVINEMLEQTSRITDEELDEVRAAGWEFTCYEDCDDGGYPHHDNAFSYEEPFKKTLFRYANDVTLPHTNVSAPLEMSVTEAYDEFATYNDGSLRSEFLEDLLWVFIHLVPHNAAHSARAYILIRDDQMKNNPAFGSPTQKIVSKDRDGGDRKDVGKGKQAYVSEECDEDEITTKTRDLVIKDLEDRLENAYAGSNVNCDGCSDDRPPPPLNNGWGLPEEAYGTFNASTTGFNNGQFGFDYSSTGWEELKAYNPTPIGFRNALNMDKPFSIARGNARNTDQASMGSVNAPNFNMDSLMGLGNAANINTASPVGLGNARKTAQASPMGLGNAANINTGFPMGLGNAPNINTVSPMGLGNARKTAQASSIGWGDAPMSDQASSMGWGNAEDGPDGVGIHDDRRYEPDSSTYNGGGEITHDKGIFSTWGERPALNVEDWVGKKKESVSKKPTHKSAPKHSKQNRQDKYHVYKFLAAKYLAAKNATESVGENQQSVAKDPKEQVEQNQQSAAKDPKESVEQNHQSAAEDGQKWWEEDQESVTKDPKKSQESQEPKQPPASKEVTITYWATIEAGDEKIHVPVEARHIDDGEKTVSSTGVKKVWKWVHDNKLEGKVSLQAAYDLANEMHRGNGRRGVSWLDDGDRFDRSAWSCGE